MFEALAEHMDTLVQIRKCTSIDGANDRVFSDTLIDMYVYRVDEINYKLNREAKEILSYMYLISLYTDEVTENDQIIIDDITYEIKLVNGYYYEGARTALVVYL